MIFAWCPVIEMTLVAFIVSFSGLFGNLWRRLVPEDKMIQLDSEIFFLWLTLFETSMQDS